MAYNNRQQEDQNRDSWWTIGLKAAAGLGVLSASAIIAAEAYKVAKEERRQAQQCRQWQEKCHGEQEMPSTSSAYTEPCEDWEDAESEEREAAQREHRSRCCTCDWSDYEEVDSDDYEEAAAQEHGGGQGRGTGTGCAELQNSVVPLMTRLEIYYTSYVLPNEERQQTERDELQNFKAFFMKYLRQQAKSLHFGRAFFAGDRSHVTIVKAYDAATKLLVIPIEMNPKTWEYVDARHSVLKAPGYFLVRRINLDFIPKGQDPWDKFMVGNYLCPAYLLRHLQKLLDCSVEEYCKMASVEPPSLTLEAKICAKMGPRVITLISSPFSHRTSFFLRGDDDSEEEEDPVKNHRPDANLWLWSFNEVVLEMLHNLDSGDGCRMKCLAIMEALRVNNSKLQVLSHSHLLAIMYIACNEETEWENKMLAERFFDVLVILTRCLSRHDLPHPRDQAVNCFIDIPSWALQRMHRWLHSIIKNPRKIGGMLKHKY